MEEVDERYFAVGCQISFFKTPPTTYCRPEHMLNVCIVSIKTIYHYNLIQFELSINVICVFLFKIFSVCLKTCVYFIVLKLLI